MHFPLTLAAYTDSLSQFELSSARVDDLYKRRAYSDYIHTELKFWLEVDLIHRAAKSYIPGNVCLNTLIAQKFK